MISFGSACSGIEAASVAWHPLGWQTSWLAEIDPFASAVLAHRYPDTENLGDMTRIPQLIRQGCIAAPDVIVGGPPCQPFSFAGLGKSLSDNRGKLTLNFVEIANANDDIRRAAGKPASLIVWENVPGILNKPDNPFGHFLAALAGEDSPLIPAGKKWPHAGCVFGPRRTIAWRVLNAEYFGLAQRRERLFVVASGGGGANPIEILFEFEGSRRDTPPCRPEGPQTTWPVAPCLTKSGRGVSRVGEIGGQDTVLAFRAAGQDGFTPSEVAPPILKTNGGGAGVPTMVSGMMVRRFTPREVEALQGFPPDYTLIWYNGKLAKDGPRYSALGNSMAINVMAWIGKRINAAILATV